MEYGLDWLRLTWRHGDEELDTVGAVVYDRLEELVAADWPVREKRLMQFRGYGTDKLQWVSSETHTMMNASGAEAHQIGTKLIEHGCSGKCTRIDTQVTADYGERDLRFAARLRESLCKSGLSVGTGTRPPNAHFEGRGGDTGITIAARSSTVYGRAYHAATGGHAGYPVGAWRFETEWKGRRAKQFWDTARAGSVLGALAASRTSGQFMAWGIEENWMVETLPSRGEPLSDTRSIAKKLRWFDEQVIPAMWKLLEDGYEDEFNAIIFKMKNHPQISRGANTALETNQNMAVLKRQRKP